MQVTLPDPEQVDKLRTFLRYVEVDSEAMRPERDMIARYKMTLKLFNRNPGDSIDTSALYAFRHVFGTILV